MDAIVGNIIDHIITMETGGDPTGAYTNYPHDPPTKWGITLTTARAEGYEGAMWNLGKDFAEHIYWFDYVKAPNFDAVIKHSQAIGAELIRAGVNLGPRKPSLWLQKALNAFNKQETAYSDIATDGIIGPATLYALGEFLSFRQVHGEEVMFKALNAQQGAEYLDLALGEEAFERFVFGWFNKRVQFYSEVDYDEP